ncbi:hypothetical protein OIE67_17480 [Nonomuraea fuscirosea]|uniref:hypothetical protein n=1 Tax=Nonomuraea fuscirosea TaxID=1291556 RepID=UPI002DD9E737|nr:hypothetical protein [Nonomuraea fuscirosea]WSA56327.1 hypothetical protein OIE67_17480 [Nonomuraea fuscirosea]
MLDGLPAGKEPAWATGLPIGTAYATLAAIAAQGAGLLTPAAAEAVADEQVTAWRATDHRLSDHRTVFLPACGAMTAVTHIEADIEADIAAELAAWNRPAGQRTWHFFRRRNPQRDYFAGRISKPLPWHDDRGGPVARRCSP